MQNSRLSKDIYPILYKLNIMTDLKKFTFEGIVDIQINVEHDRDTCVINSKNLNIFSINIDDNNVTFTEDKHNETIAIKYNFSKNIGKYHIIIKYDGDLTDSMDGYYRSSYINKNTGEINYMAVTQFESTSARQAFPCFDEPCFKAQFELTLSISSAEKDYVILSNTESQSTEIRNNIKTVIFGITPKMSTYLLAFVIGELEHISNNNKTKISISIYGVPNNKNKMSFALDVGERALKWFNKWFDIEYPLNKLDFVAIPDFSAGAMENWGLITFRESQLYCDENTDTREKQQNAITICHEIAHQWFGNLVTMEWWTYLWLNESMATYFGWIVADELFPEWELLKKFIDDEYNNALELDSLITSHPIEVPIERVADIQSIFDAISYSKGSCLVRYLANYLGEKFQKGMREYMKKNMYQNATSDNLWEALDKSGDAKKLMKSWTKQTGYPVVTVTKSDNQLIMSQQQFVRNIDKNNNNNNNINNNNKLWLIPLKILTGETSQNEILHEKETKVKINNNKNYIIVNPDRMAFCRVQYININPAKYMNVDMLTYYVDDYFALAMSGYHDISKPFDIINEIDLNNITNYNFWSTVMDNINTLDDLFDDRSIIQNTIDKVCKSLFTKNMFNNADYDLREIIIRASAVYGNNKLIIEWALKRFRNDKWMKYKYAIIKIVGMFGTKEDYEKMINLYKELDSQMKEAILFGISNFNNTDSLQLVFSGDIKYQDLWIFIRHLMFNKKMRNETRKYIYQNWDKILKIYKVGSTEILHMTKIVGIGCKTEAELQEYKSFFDTHKVEGIDTAIAQTVEKIEANIAFIKRTIKK